MWNIEEYELEYGHGFFLWSLIKNNSNFILSICRILLQSILCDLSRFLLHF